MKPLPEELRLWSSITSIPGVMSRISLLSGVEYLMFVPMSYIGFIELLFKQNEGGRDDLAYVATFYPPRKEAVFLENSDSFLVNCLLDNIK